MAGGKRNATDLVLLAGVVGLCAQAAMMTPTSSDLLALWLAAQAMAQGASEIVYVSEPLFTMRPPSEWAGMAGVAGHDGSVFPYLYPPLWAEILAPLTETMSFETLARGTLWLNIALMLATSWLAWRATGRPFGLPVFLFAGQAILHLTLIGAIALEQGQPQIFVAFLTVLSIERLSNHRENSAGAALALGAAIKVYPVLYLPFLAARGHWHAVAAFVVAGGALALVSVATAGWSLHAEFLSGLATIATTALSLPLNLSLDGVIGHFLDRGTSVDQVMSGTAGHAPGSVLVTEKGPLWSLASKAVLLATLAAFTIAFRKRPDDVLVWPAAIAVLSLVSPIAWTYHFMAAAVFAPALARRHAAWIPIVLFAPLALPIYAMPGLGAPALQHLPIVGAVLMTLFAAACLLPRRSAA